jgi:ferrous iron transport protein B
MKEIKIALAGNPNSGKTTIFNSITGANQRVANWGGVTVDLKHGKTKIDDYRLAITDLPGTYSLTAYSMEEIVARDFIIKGGADVIVDVIDSTNLERNLYLALQILEMGKPTALAFNMSDELELKGININIEQLSRILGVPIVPTVARVDKGVKDLFRLAVDVALGKTEIFNKVRVNYGRDIEKQITKISEIIGSLDIDLYGISPRWYAVKLLEEDSEVKSMFVGVQGADNLFSRVDEALAKISELYKDDTQTIISEKRYGFIHGALKETVRRQKTDRRDITDKIDNVLTHKVWAYPIFALFMWLLFQATFSIGGIFMEWIEMLFEWLASVLSDNMRATWFRDLLVEGIIGGVGGVIVFLPNILILFLGVSFLEDTGYMARIAFIMDKLMHKIGLHGKSFIPLLMGIGCSVPAIMASRTLESPKDRILTILVTPLITCSARLPVFVLFAGAFFPESAGNVIFLLYVLSFVFAFGVGLLFRKTLFRGEDQPFVMELPPYRMPTLKSVLLHMWEKGKHYLQKMGGVVLVFSIILWFMGAYPKNNTIEETYEAKIQNVREEMDILAGMYEFDEIAEQIYAFEDEIEALDNERHSKFMEQTYIGRIGNTIEPALRPAGLDWRMSVSLLTGFVAKEVVVSSMGVLYNIGTDEDEESEGLRDVLQRNYTPLQGMSFMLFVLLYTPCIVALITLIKEIHSWKWSVFSVAYQLALAWIVAVATYQLGMLFNLGTKIIGGG